MAIPQMYQRRSKRWFVPIWQTLGGLGPIRNLGPKQPFSDLWVLPEGRSRVCALAHVGPLRQQWER